MNKKGFLSLEFVILITVGMAFLLMIFPAVSKTADFSNDALMINKGFDLKEKIEFSLKELIVFKTRDKMEIKTYFEGKTRIEAKKNKMTFSIVLNNSETKEFEIKSVKGYEFEEFDKELDGSHLLVLFLKGGKIVIQEKPLLK